MKKVSVVTPSYNQAQFIEDTIKSVHRQTHSNVEHIVIDGESTDDTVSILEKYDEVLEWVSEPDSGQSNAVNKGFDQASGEIIGWLNSDDVFFDKNTLTKVVDYFEKTDSDVIYGDIALLDANSNIMKLWIVPDFDYDVLKRYCYIEQPALFFRKEVLQNNRLREDLEYVFDYEFWLRLAQRYTFTHVSSVLAGDRNHPARKILHNRSEMKDEANTIRRQYGWTEDNKSKFARITDVATSGIPRAVASLNLTLQLYRQQPSIAFDGTFKPLYEMLVNTFRPNVSLV